MQIIVDNKYYYKFQDIMMKNDTFKKANILGNEFHIYKTMEAKINDSIIIFDQHNSQSEKSIELPFRLAKKL